MTQSGQASSSVPPRFGQKRQIRDTAILVSQQNSTIDYVVEPTTNELQSSLPLAEKLGVETTPTKLLCDYTSQNGLIGILKSKAMDATDATYLNDSQEVLYALSLGKKYFKNRPSKDLMLCDGRDSEDDREHGIAVVVEAVDVFAALGQVAFQLPEFGRLLNPPGHLLGFPDGGA